MEPFNKSLGPKLLGGEVLVHLARSRVDGILSWNTAGVEAQLFFKAGRPEQAMFQSQIAATRQAVVGFVRGLAVLIDGSCKFDPKAVDVAGGLNIDTMGEVLVAMMSGFKPAQLETIWSVRGGLEVDPLPAFDKLAAAVVKVGGPQLRRPLPGSAMAALVAGASTEAQRGWTTLLALGALKILNPGAISQTETQRPTTGRIPTPADDEPEPKSDATIDAAVASVQDAPPPDTRGRPPKDPKARKIYFTVERAHNGLKDKTHYEVLGLATDCKNDTIKSVYFEKAREWHSDAFAGIELPAQTREKIEEVFRAVEDAYRTLSDKADRKTYDFVLDRHAKGLPTDPKVIFEAEGLFKKAQTLVRKGEIANAEPLLRTAVELNHGEAEFWAYLGFAVYAKEGKSALAEAKGHLNKSLEMNDKLAVAHEFRGRIERIEGNLDAAQRELKRALEINPRNVDAQREMRLLTMRQTSKGQKGSDNPLGDLLGKVFKR